MVDSNETALAALRTEFPQHCSQYVVDITSEEAVKNAVSTIAEEFGTIDILVNSAGITGKTNIKSHEVDAGNLQAVFNVNFMGSFYMSKHVLPWMLKKNYGRVLHIASIAGKEDNAGMLAYSASKAAVIAMAKVQGKEYAQTRITINALAPAVIRNSFGKSNATRTSHLYDG